MSGVGNGAYGGELIRVAGYQQHPLLIAGVHGEGERHAREDDDVVERDQQKSAHHFFTFNSYLRPVRILARRKVPASQDDLSLDR